MDVYTNQPVLGIPTGVPAAAPEYVPRTYIYRAPRITLRRRFWLEFDIVQGGDKYQGQDGHGITTPLFPQFRRLPPEIRIQIWKLVLRQPRIVTITSRYEDYYLRRPQAPPQPSSSPLTLRPPAWKPPPAELPALLTVCHESHAIAKKYYERAFAWRVPHVLTDDDDDDDDNDDGDDGQGIYGNGGYNSAFGAAADHHPLPLLATALSSLYRGEQQATSMASSGGVGRRRPTMRRRRPGGAGCWFNFDHDAVLLRGDLEPSLDAASTSVVYFMAREDLVRVRRVACSAADLGVGQLLASQLYARLFPIIDRFDIKDQLLMVGAAEKGRRKSGGWSGSSSSSSSERSASSNTNTTSSSSSTGGLHGYTTDKTDFNVIDPMEALNRCAWADVDADDDEDDYYMNGLGSYDISNNICQQVWDRWTSSTNMPLLTIAGAVAAVRPPSPAAGHEHDWPAADQAYDLVQPLYAPQEDGSDQHMVDDDDNSNENNHSDQATFMDTMRIVMVTEDKLAKLIRGVGL